VADPTFTLTIDRSQLGLADLVLDGSKGGTSPLGLTGWTEPAMRAAVDYAPDDMFTHGSRPLGWRWQQTMLNFDVAPFGAVSEAAARLLHSELVAAVTQWRFALHLDADGAARETWICDPGSVEPQGGRTVADIVNHNPGWSCSIPADPVRSVA
jgi:hypothetical protein